MSGLIGRQRMSARRPTWPAYHVRPPGDDDACLALRTTHRRRCAAVAGVADARARPQAGARGNPRREPELSRHPDRAKQVPVQARAAVRAGIGVRRRGRSRRLRSQGLAARRGCCHGSAAASAPTRCSRRRVQPLPPGVPPRTAPRSPSHMGLVPCADRSRRAEGRRNCFRAGAAGGMGTAALQIAKALARA